MAGCAIIAATILLNSSAHATNGNEITAIGPIQNSTAGAGIASPLDSTWVFTNPASIVDLDRRYDAYLDLYLVERSSDPVGIPMIPFTNGLAPRMRDNRPVLIPGFGIVLPRKDGQSAWGFGLFGVQGNSVDYPQSRVTLAIPFNADRRAQLMVAKAPIAYAHRFDNGWAVGAALVGVAAQIRTDSLTLNLVPSADQYHWSFTAGYGFKLSIYRKWEDFAFGATYTTRQWVMPFDKYQEILKYHLDQPQQFQAGIAWHPTRKLELLADYKWIDWDSVAQYGKSTLQSGVGWRDQHIFKLGARYDLNEKWQIRTGISYGRSAIPDDVSFADILFPGLVETHVGAGFTYKASEKSEISFAWMRGFENEVIDPGTGDIFSFLGRGSKNSLGMDSIGIQYTRKF